MRKIYAFSPKCPENRLADQDFHFMVPKFHIDRKISGFSLKEIDRSLLLEDFLRKSEIFVLWGFWAM